MKSLALSAMLLALCSAVSATQESTENTPSPASSIKILYEVDGSAFPSFRFGGDPQKPAYSAQPIAKGEIERCTRVLSEELRKFPPGLLTRTLKRIYLLSEITFQDVPIGGVNFRQTGTICINAGPGATDSYITRLLDHEMIHLLTSGRGSGFPFRDWTRLNPPGFRYGNGGLESIRAGLALGDGDETSRAQGFARPYGMSDIGEDIACIGEMLFSGDPSFWSSVDRHSILRSKAEMLAAFLSTVDSSLNIDLFRLLPASMFVATSNPFEPGELVYFPDGGKIVTPSNPLRTIAVPVGGAAVFPVRSGVKFVTRATTEAPENAKPSTRSPAPTPPTGYTVTYGSVGGWLIYAEGRGLVKSRGADRVVYREGDLVYFPFGGTIWRRDHAEPETILRSQTRIYPPESVVLINPGAVSE